MSIPDIVEIIEQLYVCHDKLFQLAHEKTPILVNNQVDELNQIVHKESKLVREIAELDQRRIQVIGQYLVSHGYIPNPQVTISDLIRIIFKAEEKQMLMQAHDRLKDMIQKLQEINELNQSLINQSLSFINYSIDVMYALPEDQIVYQNPNTEKRQGMRTGVFDTKA